LLGALGGVHSGKRRPFGPIGVDEGTDRQVNPDADPG